MVVIVIIGILATISISTFSGYQQKARDATRKSDLAQVKKSLMLYEIDHGTFQVAESGWKGNGGGWLSYQDDDAYQTSVVNKLIEGGYLSEKLSDISQQVQSGYMVYNCRFPDGSGYGQAGFNLFATLESIPKNTIVIDDQSHTLEGSLTSPTANDQAFLNKACASPIFLLYGKNYAVTLQKF